MVNIINGGCSQHNISQVALRSLTQSAPSKVIEYVADVDIRLIEPITEVSDFSSPSNSALPSLVKTGQQRYFCLDGWEKIDAAWEYEDAVTIRCIVKVESSSLDPSELAIRKVAARIAPKLGRIEYAEQVLAVRQLYTNLKIHSPNLIEYGHGGARVPGETAENTEDDILTVLVNRLGRRRSTIRKYINSSKFLTIDSLKTLVKLRATQEFFEAARKRIKYVKTAFSNEGKLDAEITDYVSEAIIGWHQKFLVNKGTLPAEDPALASPDDTADENNSSSDGENQYPVITFNLPTPAEVNTQSLRTREETITDIVNTCNDTVTRCNDTADDNATSEFLTETIVTLLLLRNEILNRINHEQSSGQQTEEGE